MAGSVGLRHLQIDHRVTDQETDAAIEARIERWDTGHHPGGIQLSGIQRCIAHCLSFFFSLESQDQGSWGSIVAVFAQVDSLPGSQGQRSGRHGDQQAGSEHGAFDVRGHIVGAFDGVDKGLVFRDQAIQGRFHIDANIRVGVFVDCQARRGVLQEHLEHPDSNVLEFRDCRNDLAGNQVETAAERTDSDRFLAPKHSGLFSLCSRRKASVFGWLLRQRLIWINLKVCERRLTDANVAIVQ